MSKIKLSIHVPPLQKYVTRNLPLDELERKYLHITQDDITIQQLWTDLEKGYCDQYIDSAERSNFAVKCLRDRDDYDLPRHLVISDVFGGETPPYVIRLIQTRVDRGSSLPPSSTLRAAGILPLKTLPPVPLFHETPRRKQHTPIPDDQPDPDRPLPSSERDGDEEDDDEIIASEHGQDEEQDDTQGDAERPRSFEGSTHRGSSHGGMGDSEAMQPVPSRSKSHRNKASVAATNVSEHDPEQATFLKPDLPPPRKKHAAPTYLRNPYSIGPSRQNARDSPSIYGSSRHRVEPDPYAVPETEDDERDGGSAVARKVLYQRAPRLDQTRRRSDVDAQEDESLITPDSVQKADYVDGQRRAPLTNPNFSQPKQPSNDLSTIRRPRLAALRNDDIVDDVSPELGAKKRDCEADGVRRKIRKRERQADEISEGEENAGLEASDHLQPNLRTPFNSFSAKQPPKDLQRSSPRSSTKKLKPIKSRLLGTGRLPAGAADAHDRLQSATKDRAYSVDGVSHEQQTSGEEEEETRRSDDADHQPEAKARPTPSAQVPATSQVGADTTRDSVPNFDTSVLPQKITQSPYGTQKAHVDPLRQEGRELYRALVKRQKQLAKKPNQSTESLAGVGSKATTNKSMTAGRVTQVQLSDSESEQDQTKAADPDADRARAQAASERARKYSEDYARRSASRNLPSLSSRPNTTTPAKYTAEEIFEGMFQPLEEPSTKKRKTKKAAVNDSLSSAFRATTQPPSNTNDASPDEQPRAKSAAPTGQTTSFSKDRGFDRPDGLGEASSSTGKKRKRASEPAADISKTKQAKLAEIKKEQVGKQKGVIPNHMLDDDPITLTDSDAASAIHRSSGKKSNKSTSNGNVPVNKPGESCLTCRSKKRKCLRLPTGPCETCLKRGDRCSFPRNSKRPDLQQSGDQEVFSGTQQSVQPVISDPHAAISSDVAVVVPPAPKRRRGLRQVDGEEASLGQFQDKQASPSSFGLPPSQPRDSQKRPSLSTKDNAATGSDEAAETTSLSSEAGRDKTHDIPQQEQANSDQASNDQSSPSAPEPDDDPNEQLEHEKILGAWTRMTDKSRRPPTPATSTQVPISSTPKPNSSMPKPTSATLKPALSAPKPVSSTPKPASSKPKSSILGIEQESDSGMEGLPKNPQAPQNARKSQKVSSVATKAKSSAPPKSKKMAKSKKRAQANDANDANDSGTSSGTTSSGTHSSVDGMSLEQMEKDKLAAQTDSTAAPAEVPSRASATPRPSIPTSSMSDSTVKASTKKKSKTSSSNSPTESDSMDEYDNMNERPDDVLTDEQKKRLAQVPLEKRHKERMYMIGKSASSSDAPQAEQRESTPPCAPSASSAPSAGWLSSVRKAVGWMNREDPWWEEAQAEARRRANA